MTLLLTTLTNQLQTYLQNNASESQAIQNFALAYSTYAADATANSVALKAPAISTGKAAIVAAMAGLNSPGNAATAMQKGCVAFWANLATQPTVAFPPATLLTPPLFAGLIPALQAIFLSNTANKTITSNTALANIANVLHTQTLIGGAVSFPGPLVAAIL